VTDLPSEWARLHPLSPIVRAARVLAALGVVVLTRQVGTHNRQLLWFDAVAVGLAVVAGVVTWLVTRWRIHNGELQVETGLFRRQSVRLPLSRLQAVDVVRPLLGRALGLAEVRVVMAGHGSSSTRLAYLTETRADDVRAQLIALAHGLDAATPTAPERPLVSVPSGRIVAAGLLSAPALLVLVAVVVCVVLLVVDTRAGVAAFGTVVLIAIGIGLAVARQIGAEWEFTLAESPDGLRVRAGLLQTRAETVPLARVQAIRVLQPLWWRPLGWVRLEIDLARRHDRDRAEGEVSSTTTRALLPVGTPELAAWLVERVLPGAPLREPPDARPPRRALLRAPLVWHNLRAWHDARYVVCQSGRVRRATVVVPLAKAQSFRWVQGPLSRRLGVASVHVDTAGRRFPASAFLRPKSQAARWIAELPVLARLARGG